jgi:hypothetical protein
LTPPFPYKIGHKVLESSVYSHNNIASTFAFIENLNLIEVLSQYWVNGREVKMSQKRKQEKKNKKQELADSLNRLKLFL